MGRKSSKSTIERLPKGERTHPSPKILIRPLQKPPSPRRPTSTRPRNPTLVDDHALAAVLLHAGPMAILSALQVSSQWRRVAKSVIDHVHRIDLGALYRINNARASPPTLISVVTTLLKFPKLTVLTMHKWPYMDLMQDIAAFVAAYFQSSQLQELEISTLPVSGANVVRLLERCPAVRTLRMAGHDCISDDMLAEIGAGCRRAVANSPTHRLHAIHIARSRSVTGLGVTNLLYTPVAQNVFVTKCPSVKNVHWTPTHDPPTNQLSLTGCLNLAAFHIYRKACNPPAAFDVEQLNLSHCTSLVNFQFHAKGGEQMNVPLRIRKLNLSGCRSLHMLTSDLTSPASLSFQNLEELSLFGARSINPVAFSSTINFAIPEIVLPKLRKLDLNGTTIEALKLVGYDQLQSIDCSGCPLLDVLWIENCWNLQKVAVKGRRIPLQNVKLVLPALCLVEGKRANWHWERFQSKQLISYP